MLLVIFLLYLVRGSKRLLTGTNFECVEAGEKFDIFLNLAGHTEEEADTTERYRNY